MATDFRLWLRDGLDDLDNKLRALQEVLLNQAGKHAATTMPGFTHLQPAQPVTFGHHLLAYVEMAGRDRARFVDCRKRVNEMPLGAAALAGTSFPIDRSPVAKTLGFAWSRWPIPSMWYRRAADFALEFMASASIAGMHLSRLAEEIVIWASPAFDLTIAKLSEAFTTGSSIIPQKRNPDAAELVRAKTGRLLGDFNALFVVMKGSTRSPTPRICRKTRNTCSMRWTAIAFSHCGDDRHDRRHEAGCESHAARPVGRGL